jgi:hypothetical protein
VHISNSLSQHQLQNGLNGPKLGQSWTKVGQNWAKIGQKEPNWIGVPILNIRIVPFGSRHRFDCHDHPQGIKKVGVSHRDIVGEFLQGVI